MSIILQIAVGALALINSIYEEPNSWEMNSLLSIYANEYGVDSPEYADCVLWCATRLAEYEAIGEAEQLVKHSTYLYKKYGNGSFNGRDSISQILYLDALSCIAKMKGQEYLQMRYSEQSLLLKKEVLGSESDAYLNNLLDLAELYADRLMYTRSRKTHNSGYETYVNLIRREFSRLPESQRQTYWDHVSGYIDKTITMAHRNASDKGTIKSKELSKAAYNASLLSKGLLLNTTIGFETYVRNSGIESAVTLLNQKKAAMEKFAETKTLDSLDYAILHELAVHDKPFKVAHLELTWDSVRANLGEHDIALEFYRTRLGSYGVLALRQSWSSPKMIPLFEESEVNSLLHKKTNGENWIDIGYTYAYKGRGKQLKELIWDKILPYLHPEDNIFFSPIGILHIVAIENLPFDMQSTISAHYSITRLSSTRELAIKKQPTLFQTASLYGNIDYSELSDSVMKANSIKYAHRGFMHFSIDEQLEGITRGGATKSLPNTKKEIETIYPILIKNNIDVSIYSNDTANEESVKALSGTKQNILHFATHGFFWKPSRKHRDPLERTGLVFAGVDKIRMKGSNAIPDDVDDGILTAKEIASLDFQSTDIVVMSACETGLGDISGDGVFGLQRAFKMAGAQTIIMALWQVNDKATQILMTEFYRNYFERKMSKREAFREAQQTVKKSSYKDGSITIYFNSPYYWAGFILLD